MTRRIVFGFALLSTLLVAVAAPAMVVIDLTDPHVKGGWNHPAYGVISVVGAWGAFAAWVTDKRLLAVPGHFASVLAPWGYLYPIPLLAIVLALMAGATFKSGRVDTDPFLSV